MRKNIVLEVNKKKIDFRFGLYFLGEVLEALDCDIESLMNKIAKNQFKTVPYMMYQSALSGYVKKGKDIDFDLMDLTEWLSEHGIGGNNKVTEAYLLAFYESLNPNLPEEEDDKKGEKKN